MPDSPRSSWQALACPERILRILCALSAAAVLIAIRVHFLEMPLERDEGEYAYAGQLMLDGIAPYKDMYSMKWPGTYMAYALVMCIFGETPGAVHFGLLLVNMTTSALVFAIGVRMYPAATAAVAATACATLSTIPPIYGFAGHATHFVALFALGAVALLQGLDDETAPGRIFIAGLLLGLCMLMKQAGGAFAIFAAVWIVRCEMVGQLERWTRLGLRLALLGLGCLLPILIMCSMLYGLGVFDRFWLWTFRYAGRYASIIGVEEGMSSLLFHARWLFRSAPELWSLAGLGIPLLFLDPSARKWRFFVLSFALFSFVAVCPGWYFRGHYFLLLLPAAGLLTGFTVQSISRWLSEAWPCFSRDAITTLLFLPIFVWSLLECRTFLFRLTPDQASRVIYGGDPFPESVEVSRYLATHCPPRGRVAIIGSEPQIYFYSRRRSATGYIYTFPLMEPQPFALDMQRDMIHEIEATEPDYVVFVNIEGSWQAQPASPSMIFDWFRDYQRKQLDLVAVVRILSPDRTEYDWGLAGPPKLPQSGAWLGIWKQRKPAVPQTSSSQTG